MQEGAGRKRPAPSCLLPGLQPLSAIIHPHLFILLPCRLLGALAKGIPGNGRQSELARCLQEAGSDCGAWQECKSHASSSMAHRFGMTAKQMSNLSACLMWQTGTYVF